MTDSLRVWQKLPEQSDRLTMLVIVGTKTAKHSLRNQVGMGSESHCLGQLHNMLEISDSEAGLKVEKSGCVYLEKKVNQVILLAKERRSLDILSVKKEAQYFKYCDRISYHQMRLFYLRMQQNAFAAGLYPDPLGEL